MKSVQSPYDHGTCIAVIDSDESYLNELRNRLVLSGYRNTFATTCSLGAAMLIGENRIKVIFIEISDLYSCIWETMKSSNRAFVVAMTHEKDDALWTSALKKGADTVLLKQDMSAHLTPLLLCLQAKLSPHAANVIRFPFEQDK